MDACEFGSIGDDHMGKRIKDNKDVFGSLDDETIYLCHFGQGPEEFRDAIVVDSFVTSQSESYLLDIGSFDDGMRMYVMAEKFKTNDWNWCNTFPEMDAMQLASYLEGRAETCEENDEYRKGLKQIARTLRQQEMI